MDRSDSMNTEDDEDLCEHGKPSPCPYCQFDRLLERADMTLEERC